MSQACAISGEFHIADPLALDIDDFWKALDEVERVMKNHANR